MNSVGETFLMLAIFPEDQTYHLQLPTSISLHDRSKKLNYFSSFSNKKIFYS